MKAQALATALIACGLLGAPAAMAQQSSGSSDPLTYSIQQQLRQQGIYQGNMDGIWGPDTERAVSQFQRQRGMNPTGQLTVGTLEALRLPRNTPIPMGGQSESSYENQSGQGYGYQGPGYGQQQRGYGPNQGYQQRSYGNREGYGENQYNPNEGYRQNQQERFEGNQGYSSPNQERGNQ